MKLTFKDLKQQKFVIDAEPSETASSSTATPSQAPSTPSRAATSTPAAPPAPAPSTNASATAPPATPSPAAATQPSDAAFNDPSALLSGSQGEAVISHMETRYTSADDTHNNHQGIPENIQQEQEQQQQQQQAATATAASPQPPAASAGGNAPATTGGEEPVNLFEAAAQAGTQEGPHGARSGSAAGEGLPNLDFLRNNPHFQQLRQLVQQQPQMLEPILQQVAAGNPQIAQLIGQNEEQFLQLLSEEGDGALPPGTHQIHVTEEERDAIERVRLPNASYLCIISRRVEG
ncbi:unnamed protein product [Aspergillus oryzae]|uniref:UV excision repair protein RAD23 n=2 Tax=Aspergillus oryzae TaxID=5062 RepID=A0AAN4YVD2_ASPOZ|nr:unnamed protein product [Aspergillus oryzae]GMF92503.1 unnamed protein product [Aspergillus oryzae]GMG36021.1 unnamed protein product [Aspergillus oryzae]GMG46227.1 unnamed protein product [Aspergillus oryzae var. brunneus]